ncbi:MAG: patatin family protein [Firmicutes bacterium]|nr:patatin family protein [Bacillota bacterium]
MQSRKVGIALGAGAARGLAHIGVLEVLLEHGIQFDIITGTSMGAVVGGLYASGAELSMLKRMAIELNWDDLVRITLPRLGLVSSERIYQILKILTKNQQFEDLPFKLAVVAADINNGEEVVIDSGSVADGIRASLSIPGVFVPVEYHGRMLVDGAIVNRVPGTVARNLGADFLIEVDVGYPPLRGKASNLADVIIRTIDILDRQSTKYRPKISDITICPDLKDVMPTQLNRAEEIIDAGREAALMRVDDIKAKLNQNLMSG